MRRTVNEVPKDQCARWRRRSGVRSVQLAGCQRARRRLRAPARASRRQQAATRRRRAGPQAADTSKGTVKVAVALPLTRAASWRLGGRSTTAINLAVEGERGGVRRRLRDRDPRCLRRRGQRLRTTRRRGASQRDHDRDRRDLRRASARSTRASPSGADPDHERSAESCSAARRTRTRASRSPSSVRSTCARPTRTASTTSASSPPTTTRAPRRPSTSSENLGKKNVFIIDDTETFGDRHRRQLRGLLRGMGGTVVDRQGVAEDDDRLHGDPDRRQGQEPRLRSTSAASRPPAAARILQGGAIQAGLRRPVRRS